MAQVFKGAGTKVAKLPGIQPLLDKAATRIKAAAASNISSSSAGSTGAYASNLEVRKVRGKKGVMDRLVVANDPGALSIEYGHLQGDPGGSPTWVPGKFPLTNAIRMGGI